MESCTAIMALDSQGTSLVLHREVIPNRSGTITYEVVGLGESALFDKLVEEIVQGFLEGLNRIISRDGWMFEYLQDRRWPQVGRQSLVSRRSFVYLDRTPMIYTFRARNLEEYERRFGMRSVR